MSLEQYKLLLLLWLHRVCLDTSCCLSYLFVLYLLITASISSLTQSFFRSMLLNFHIFVSFFNSFLQLNSNFKDLLSGNTLGMISIFSNWFRFVLRPSIWSILEKVSRALEKVYNLMFWDEALRKCLWRPLGPVCHLRPIFLYWFSLWMIYLKLPMLFRISSYDCVLVCCSF